MRLLCCRKATLVDEPGGHEVEMRAARILEDRDLVRGEPPALATAAEIEEIAGDPVPGERARLHRAGDVAALIDREPARIDKDSGTPHRLVVGLAHLVGVAADEVEMRAGAQP